MDLKAKTTQSILCTNTGKKVEAKFSIYTEIESTLKKFASGNNLWIDTELPQNILE